METTSKSLVGHGSHFITAAPILPWDICDLIIDILVKPLLGARRRRAFAFTVSEDLELHREELKCKATLAAGARISKAWHYPFQYRLTQHIWVSSDTHLARLASRSYTANPSLVQEITIDPSGQGVCNPAPYSCHCVVGLLGQFPSAATLSLCGVAWIVHPRCMHRFVMHQHITRLALVWVHFQSVMHFRLLLEALPMLYALECNHVFADETEESDETMMARCSNLRELKILDIDAHISAFFGNIEHGTDTPPVEILSVALTVEFIERDGHGWEKYRAILDTYSESIRELKLMLHVQNENFRTTSMLPGSLANYTNLQKITMVLRVTPAPRFYSCFTSLLSNISTTRLSNMTISFRPMPSCRNISPKGLVTLLDISPVLRTMDEMLADEQFESIHQQGVHVELATPFSELGVILDNALEPTGGWEESVKQWMPHINSAGLLRCVR